MDLFSTKLIQLLRTDVEMTLEDLFKMACKCLFCYEQVFGSLTLQDSPNHLSDQKQAAKYCQRLNCSPQRFLYALELVDEALGIGRSSNLFDAVLLKISTQLGFESLTEFRKTAAELAKYHGLFELNISLQLSLQYSLVLTNGVEELRCLSGLGQYPLAYVAQMALQLKQILQQQITTQNVEIAALLKLKKLTVVGKLVKEGQWACQLLYIQIENSMGRFISACRGSLSKPADFKHLFQIDAAYSIACDLFENQTQFAYYVQRQLPPEVTQLDLVARYVRMSPQQVRRVLDDDFLLVLDDQQREMWRETNSDQLRAIKKELMLIYPTMAKAILDGGCDMELTIKITARSREFIVAITELDCTLILLLISKTGMNDQNLASVYRNGFQIFASLVKEEVLQGRPTVNKYVIAEIQNEIRDGLQVVEENRTLIGQFLEFFMATRFVNHINNLQANIPCLTYFLQNTHVYEFSLLEVFRFMIRKGVINSTKLTIQQQIYIIVSGNKDQVVKPEELSSPNIEVLAEIQSLLLGIKDSPNDQIFQMHSLNLLLQYSHVRISGSLTKLLENSSPVTKDE